LQAAEQTPYADLQSFQAAKVVTEGRAALHFFPHIASTFICRDSPWSPRMF
jgi:hypothetical protein